MYVIGTPEGWPSWWKICMLGAVIFIPFIFMMSGYWTTAKARAARLGSQPTEPQIPEIPASH